MSLWSKRSSHGAPCARLDHVAREWTCAPRGGDGAHEGRTLLHILKSKLLVAYRLLLDPIHDALAYTRSCAHTLATAHAQLRAHARDRTCAAERTCPRAYSRSCAHEEPRHVLSIHEEGRSWLGGDTSRKRPDASWVRRGGKSSMASIQGTRVPMSILALAHRRRLARRTSGAREGFARSRRRPGGTSVG